jgi:hypothetical protein
LVVVRGLAAVIPLWYVKEGPAAPDETMLKRSLKSVLKRSLKSVLGLGITTPGSTLYKRAEMLARLDLTEPARLVMVHCT